MTIRIPAELMPFKYTHPATGVVQDLTLSDYPDYTSMWRGRRMALRNKKRRSMWRAKGWILWCTEEEDTIEHTSFGQWCAWWPSFHEGIEWYPKEYKEYKKREKLEIEESNRL